MAVSFAIDRSEMPVSAFLTVPEASLISLLLYFIGLMRARLRRSGGPVPNASAAKCAPDAVVMFVGRGECQYLLRRTDCIRE